MALCRSRSLSFYAAFSSIEFPLLRRGDAAKLPEQALDLCEIEPLRQEEAGSTRWVPGWTDVWL